MLRVFRKYLILLCLASAVTLGQDPFHLQLSTPSIYVGSSGNRLEVRLWNGSSRVNATSDLVIRWNGVPLTTSLEGTDPSLVAAVPDEFVASCGLAEITVASRTAHTVWPASGWMTPVLRVYGIQGMVADPVRGILYLTIGEQWSGGENSPFPAHSLVALEARTCQVRKILPLSPNPSVIALSGDGQILYVAFQWSGVIQKIETTSFSVLSQFSLIPDTAPGTTPPQVLAMEVSPGNADVLAVNSGERLALYDRGIRRANAVAGSDGQPKFRNANELLCTTSSAALAAYKVDQQGLYLRLEKPIDTPGNIIGLTDSHLFLSSGQTIRIDDLTEVGRTPLNLGFLVPGIGRLLSVVSNSSTFEYRLQAFDAQTLVPLGEQRVFLGYSLGFERVFHWGGAGIAILSPGNPITLASFRTPLLDPAPLLTREGIANAASLVSGSVSPGQILSLFGTNLGPGGGKSFDLTGPGRTTQILAGTSVLFDKLPGTVLYTGPSQINVVAPFKLPVQKDSVKIQVLRHGIPSLQVTMPVANASPGIFTQSGSGIGAAAVLNQDGSLNTPARPAPKGSVVSLFATGGGQTEMPSEDARLTPDAQRRVAFPVHVRFGEADAAIFYAGGAPGLIGGALQINAQIPLSAPSGDAVPLIVEIDGRPSRAGVTVSVQ